MLRFGGPVFLENSNAPGGAGESHAVKSFDPEELVAAHKRKGFTAAYCPEIDVNDDQLIKDTKAAFQRENIMLAETAYWENLMDSDEASRKYHREKQVEAFYLGDCLGAKVNTNIWGSHCHGNGNSVHTGSNFSEDAFAEAVDLARYLIDTVKPKNTCFAYEIFPFDITYSIDNIERLVKAVDREKFGVHYDHVNLICDCHTYFNNAKVAEEMLKRLGHKIVCGHVKDIWLEEPSISVILKEVVAGNGIIDYKAFLGGVHKLPQEVPMLMEHLGSEAEYDTAHNFIRNQLATIGINI